MARNRPVLDGDSHSSTDEKEQTEDGSIDRRSYLKLTTGAVAAALSTAAVPSVTADDGVDVIDLDYDQYSRPSDVYRVWTCDPSQASFTNESAYSGSQGLEIALGSGGSCGTNTHFNVEQELGYQPRELYDSFMFKLSEDWTMNDMDQCKISRAAMSYSAGDGHSGGDSATGENGWSAGLVLANRGSGSRNGGPYNLAAYVYHLDSRAQDNSGPWETTMIEPGEWYHIEQYVRLNTVDSNGNANRDGVYRVWVDGDLGFERNYRWTTDFTNNAIEYCGPYIRYGGGETAPRDMAAYYDDHTMYIGGTPEEVGTAPSEPDDDSDEEQEYEERFTYRDPEQTSEYEIYVDGEIIQDDWSQATYNDTVEITEEGGYQVVNGTSPPDNVDGYRFNGDVVAISSEYEPRMWITGEEIFLEDYPDVPEDLEDEDENEEFDERFTYRDPDQTSEYEIYVDGEIIQEDWSQATYNDTVEITEEGGYQVVTATSPPDNVDGYLFDGEVVAISSEYEPRMWITGEEIFLEDYPDVPEDLESEETDESDDSDESSSSEPEDEDDGSEDSSSSGQRQYRIYDLWTWLN